MSSGNLTLCNILITCDNLHGNELIYSIYSLLESRWNNFNIIHTKWAIDRASLYLVFPCFKPPANVN